MIKATFGGVRVEIWFTPSFNVKTTDKTLEMMLRNVEVESFDPWKQAVRTVKPTKSEKDAYLFLSEFNTRVPELKVTFEMAPELPSSIDQGTEENPVIH